MVQQKKKEKLVSTVPESATKRRLCLKESKWGISIRASLCCAPNETIRNLLTSKGASEKLTNHPNSKVDQTARKHDTRKPSGLFAMKTLSL